MLINLLEDLKKFGIDARSGTVDLNEILALTISLWIPKFGIVKTFILFSFSREMLKTFQCLATSENG